MMETVQMSSPALCFQQGVVQIVAARYVLVRPELAGEKHRRDLQGVFTERSLYLLALLWRDEQGETNTFEERYRLRLRSGFPRCFGAKMPAMAILGQAKINQMLGAQATCIVLAMLSGRGRHRLNKQ